MPWKSSHGISMDSHRKNPDDHHLSQKSPNVIITIIFHIYIYIYTSDNYINKYIYIYIWYVYIYIYAHIFLFIIIYHNMSWYIIIYHIHIYKRWYSTYISQYVAMFTELPPSTLRHRTLNHSEVYRFTLKNPCLLSVPFDWRIQVTWCVPTMKLTWGTWGFSWANHGKTMGKTKENWKKTWETHGKMGRS